MKKVTVEPSCSCSPARLVRALATLIQRAGGAAYVEPRYLEDKRPDIHAFFPDDRVMLDVCVSHPSSPSRLSLAPGYALSYRENAKIAGYSSLRILVVVLCLLRLSLLAPWSCGCGVFAGFSSVVR